LLSYAETQKLLEDLPQEQQKLIGDLVPALISTGGIQRVLQALLIERVSIRDLPTILEGIQEGCAAGQRGTASILAIVRVRLGRQISEAYRSTRGYIPIIPLSGEWEHEFSTAVTGPVEDRQLAMLPSKLSEFIQAFRGAVDGAIAGGDTPVLLTSALNRQQVRMVIDRVRPEIPVLAQVEIAPRARIRTVGSV
jgi:flagellar biosynthesis protein FlhA